MKCSSASLPDFGNRVFNTIRSNPKRSLAFALGTILLLTGIVGHCYGMNMIAVGVLTSLSGPCFAAFILSLVCCKFQQTPLSDEFDEDDMVSAEEFTDFDVEILFPLNGLELELKSDINKALVDDKEGCAKILQKSNAEDLAAVEENFYQLNALHFAVLSGSVDHVSKVLEKNTDLINVPISKEGKSYSPLHLAVRKNNPEMVKRLLESKPNLTAEDTNGRTSLKLAKNLVHKECSQLISDAK